MRCTTVGSTVVLYAVERQSKWPADQEIIPSSKPSMWPMHIGVFKKYTKKTFNYLHKIPQKLSPSKSFKKNFHWYFNNTKFLSCHVTTYNWVLIFDDQTKHVYTFKNASKKSKHPNQRFFSAKLRNKLSPFGQSDARLAGGLC